MSVIRYAKGKERLQVEGTILEALFWGKRIVHEWLESRAWVRRRRGALTLYEDYYRSMIYDVFTKYRGSLNLRMVRVTR